MIYFLLGSSIITSVIYSTMNNVFSKKAIKNNSDFYLYNTICSFAAAVLFFILSGAMKSMSLYTLIVGLVFAAIMFGAQYTNIKAFKYGPMSYTTMFSSCGMILPAFAGILFWREKFSLFQLLGTVILVISFVVGTNFKKHENITLKWLKYALLLFIFAGVIGIIQKIHQSSSHKSEMFSLLFIVFFVMCICSFIMYILEKNNGSVTFKLKAKTVLWCALIGLFTAFSHVTNLYLSGKMDSMFFFPVFNGSFTVVCFLVSIVLLKEKLDLIQKLSFILGVVGLVCLGIGG